MVPLGPLSAGHEMGHDHNLTLSAPLLPVKLAYYENVHIQARRSPNEQHSALRAYLSFRLLLSP
jgi:hypothetical protein